MMKRLSVVVMLVAGILSVAAAPGLARPQRQTSPSAARTGDALMLANGYLSQLACASATQCTAVEPSGAAVTFNPIGAGAVTHTKPLAADGTIAITCPSTASCVEADAAGDVAVFAPRRAAAKAASFTVTGAQSQTTVACPSAAECVAETYTGAAVFDPAHPGSPKSTTITANGSGGQPTLACPSASLCVGSDGNDGSLYSYAPGAPASAKVHAVTSTPQIGSLDCASRSFCVALASPKTGIGVNLGYIAFNPSRPGNPGVTKLTDGSLEFLTCASATLCAAAGNNGGVFTFDPKRPGHAHLTLAPSGQDFAGIAFAGRSLVLISFSGTKAVIDPGAPPKTVALVGLSKAAKVAAG